ncbi:MAG: VWA domain-containing protein [Bacteroidales bacterium]
MKKLTFCILSLLLFFELVNSQPTKQAPISATSPKSVFDLSVPSGDPALKSGFVDGSKKIARLQTWEYSLLNNGCFTLGTNHGFGNTSMDDQCEFTFGHPYSMTSFAYPVIDGRRYLPFELSANNPQSVFLAGDSLFSEPSIPGLVQTLIKIYPIDSVSIILEYTIKNLDSISHLAEMGLLFDAAIGKWGDGFINWNNSPVQIVSKFDGTFFDSILICERKQNPHGMGIMLFPELNRPDKIVLGNWYSEFTGDTTTTQLYDLAFHATWQPLNLVPNSTIEFRMRFTMHDPEFGNQAFIRWDMPNSLSIENQQLFPEDLWTNVEISNNSQTYSSVRLQIPETDNTFGWQTDIPFQMNSTQKKVYQAALVRLPEIYDSVVSPITLQLIESGVVKDELSRNIFIPASPFTNEGLHVEIDTLTSSYGKVNISFHCTVEETGQLLSKLHKNNAFIFENDVPVENFTLGKDTSGGINNVDIVFVLDVTGSMTEEIKSVRDNIIEFADSLSYRGIDYRLGMITFLDEIENTYDFTNDVQMFQANVAAQYAHGGGDTPENSLEALSLGSRFNFREDANRIIIWITDANFHINNQNTQLTKEIVIAELLSMGITVHCIGDPYYQTEYYDQITMSTEGSFYNINSNFRDILLEVSRLGQATRHMISILHQGPMNPETLFKLEIHYAGLGGMDTVKLGSSLKSTRESGLTSVLFFPNPFSSAAHLLIDGSTPVTYKIELYNMQGQLLQSKSFSTHMKKFQLELQELFDLSEVKPDQVLLLKTCVLSDEGNVLDYTTQKIKKY